MLNKIKYIAAYQTQHVSAIMQSASVDRIEPYGEEGKYKLIFSEKAQPIGPIPYADATPGAMQGLVTQPLKSSRMPRNSLT